MLTCEWDSFFNSSEWSHLEASDFNKNLFNGFSTSLAPVNSNEQRRVLLGLPFLEIGPTRTVSEYDRLEPVWLYELRHR